MLLVSSIRFVSPTEVIAAVSSTEPLIDLSRESQLAGLIKIGTSSILSEFAGGSLVKLALSAHTDPLAVVQKLEGLALVDWAAPNYVYNPPSGGSVREFIPNDPLYGNQPHHTVMHNDWSWDISQGDPRITIAITDDGVDLAHADLYENVWINQAEIPASRRANLTDLNGDGHISMRELNDLANHGAFKITDQNGNGRIDALDLLTPMTIDGAGSDLGSGGWVNGLDDGTNNYIDDLTGWDVSAGDNNPSPSSGSSHGTHVAGIATARTDNALGVAGSAGSVTLMPIRFFGSGSWTSAKIYSAYAYAADNGARIVSTSYNVEAFVGDPTFAAALNYVFAKGVLHFNSAGNSNQSNPARGKFDQTLYVVSTSNLDRKSSFSNYGYTMDIAAPGENIHSTLPHDGYGSLSGTSMATPNAAGVAALIWSLYPDWTRDQVAARLMSSADDIDSANLSFAGQLGAGRVNTYRALLEPTGPPVLGDLIGLPAEGGTTTARIRSFQLDVASVLDSASVMNAASWELRRAGLDGRFDTSDDVSIPVNLTTNYLIGTNRLSFSLNGTLSPGRYQFRANSGGLRDPFGQPLDGNGDYVGGDTFVRNFTVSLAGNIIVRSLISNSTTGGETGQGTLAVFSRTQSFSAGADVILAPSSGVNRASRPARVGPQTIAPSPDALGLAGLTEDRTL